MISLGDTKSFSTHPYKAGRIEALTHRKDKWREGSYQQRGVSGTEFLLEVWSAGPQKALRIQPPPTLQAAPRPTHKLEGSPKTVGHRFAFNT